MARKMKKFDDQGRADRAVAKITAGADEPVKTKVDMGLASTKSMPKLGDSMSFGEAFRAARSSGDKTFNWRGKSFTTQMAGEAPVKKAQANKPATSTPANKPATPAPRRDTGDSAAKITADIKRGSPLTQPSTTPDKVPAFNREALLGQPDKIAQAQSRAKQYWEQGKANIARDQSMSEADKVKARMKQLGVPGYKKGGSAKKKPVMKKFAKGGSVDGCAIRGKTRAPMRKK